MELNQKPQSVIKDVHNAKNRHRVSEHQTKGGPVSLHPP